MGRPKVRAWDKKEKRMLYNVGFRYGDTGIVVLPELAMVNPPGAEYGYDYLYINEQGKQDDRFEFMTFTGLYDKQGKEIWESDIVRSKSWDDLYEDNQEARDSHMGVVKFGECYINGQEYEAYGFYVDNDNKELLTANDDWIVIGNKFENPTLLDKGNIN